MNASLHFSLVGGDARQLHLARLLALDGHTVTTLALSDAPADLSVLPNAQVLLLPMPPAGPDGMLHAPLAPASVPFAQVLDAARPGQLLFAGKVDPPVQEQAARRGLALHDYLLREELAIANAVPTAEGALQLAMEALPITLHQSRVLVAGFGRVGQCTAARFAALGARVTVTARSSAQLALCESMGLTPLPLSALGEGGQAWDLVVNTVPAPLFGAAQLAVLGRPVLLELASRPGGFDLEAAERLGLRCISAPGLPGKVAPVTAAQAIQKTLYVMLEELGF